MARLSNPKAKIEKSCSDITPAIFNESNTMTTPNKLKGIGIFEPSNSPR